MRQRVKKIKFQGKYSDENGNRVICGNSIVAENVNIIFRGKNNTLIISDNRRSIKNLKI